MKYYLPDPMGFPSQLNKPGCVSIVDLEKAIEQNFPVEAEHFRPFACTVETDSRWCYYRDRKFRFKRTDDAIVFKLTWGGE